MQVADRVLQGAQKILSTASRRLEDYAIRRIVPGVGKTGVPSTLVPDSEAQRRADSLDAMLGRASTRLGPIPSFVSTHPLRDLTPERIAAIDSMVRRTGIMFLKADLDEDLIRADAHVRAVDTNFREDLVGAPFSVEPADGSELAQAVAAWQHRVLSDCCDFRASAKRLLFGRLAGYAVEEVIYDWRDIEIPVGNGAATVSSLVPVGFEHVHNRHTRFNLGYGDILELDTGGKFIVPKRNKYLVFEADDDFQVRLRGYGYTAIWLSMIKQNAWVRWDMLLKIWGIRGPMAFADHNVWQNKTLRDEIVALLQQWGQGFGVSLPDSVEVKASDGIADGDSRGMHAALIGIINAELSKLIQGEQLTVETGGAGSYALSETHADTMASKVESAALNLSANQRKWLREMLRVGCYEINPDGSYGDVNPRGLCGALGATPEKILSVCGVPKWRVHRDMAPTARIALYDAAVNKLGLSIADDGPYEEFGFARARGNAIKGAPQVVSGDAALVTTEKAAQGFVNPKEEQNGS